MHQPGEVPVRFHSCKSNRLYKYLMSPVMWKETASVASVALQDPDKRPVRGKTVRGAVLAKRCQRGVDGHVKSLQRRAS